MEFVELNNRIKEQFSEMQKHKLFRVKISGQDIWDTYLNGFKPGQNPIFRDPDSSEANCNNDKNFIRRYGNVVALNESLEIISMFDITVGEKYEDTVRGLQTLIKGSEVEEVFFETFDELNSLPYEKTSKTQPKFQLGHEKTLKQYTKEEVSKFGVVNSKDIYIFNHFHVYLNKQFVDMTGKSVEAIMGAFRDNKNVFQRTMLEIPLSTLELVKDLTTQGSLLDAETHLFKVEQFITLKAEYDSLERGHDNWCWLKSYGFALAKFKNELIGTLCTDLAKGVDLEKACQDWNKRVDPANYLKAVKPITEKQKVEARKFVEENGYVESFDRRFATLEDVRVSEILHSNVGDDKLKPVSIFDNVKVALPKQKIGDFANVQEVGISKFMEEILPTCTSLEAFLTNGQSGNLVTLTTANTPDSRPIFKWDNNYSWTFNGNLAGKSQIKENVKAVGGKITGILRSSLQWNDEDTRGIIDFDLHCRTPYTDICYNNKQDTVSGGWLDVDMINPTEIGIENITWQKTLKDGTYKFFVRNFSRHTNHSGFKMEIEFEGETFNYHCTQRFTADVDVATITVKNGVMSIKHHLPETSQSSTLYGLETNKFHKVNLVSLSPNHWGENNVGNKHYFFFLEDCKCDSSIRSFHNENLKADLLPFRKVMDVLGSVNTLEPTGKQLSGIGFNATVREDLIVRVNKRVYKIKF